ncbi:MAG: hypothetical protein JNK85_09995 [Verrucomicrobiales bacterium]|nr:hypothetical protein [Verrucomicrobiales bacterium]
MIWLSRILTLILAFPWFQGITNAATLVSWRTETSTFELNDDGSLGAIRPTGGTQNYLAQGRLAALISLRIDGELHPPTLAQWDPATRRLTLRFGDTGVIAGVAVRERPSHVTFEVVSVEPIARVDLLKWGPYPITIREIIGETVGVVRNREFAVGLQALNVRTLGGTGLSESDIEEGGSDQDPDVYDDLPAEILKDQGYRTDTARRTPFGSVLQAYCRQRDRERVVANWGHEKYLVPPLADGGVVGSSVALFAGPAPRALEIIGQIEEAEGLPHPLIDGVWAKVSPKATASYLIVDFSESTVDRAIEMTRRAGLEYLYHSSPFATWGKFQLKPDLFPGGWDGLRRCVQKAREAGVKVGFHTLSNFITPNDPFVSPKPDPRLARIGSAELVENVDAAAREMVISNPDFFRKKTALNGVVVGHELIRYKEVSAAAPWRLLECERGAWGTSATAHQRGAAVGRLLDHDYKVFLSNADLSQEIARQIAALFNHSGAMQLSFDGLEGNWSTGYGQYGCALFTRAWYDALKPELRGQVINDASLPGHSNWHINTRMNWGEPWYGGFRESQTLYRFKNQVYFERNLMPRMLGWFALRPETSVEDAEWLLARAAGFHAGFTLATSLASTAQLEADPRSADTARKFGAVPAILEAIRHWETARMARAFPDTIRAALRDNSREFHLQPTGARAWNLHEVFLHRFTHDLARTEPSQFAFDARELAQPLTWTLASTAKAPLTGIQLTWNDAAVADLAAVTIPLGGRLRYGGGPDLVVTDAGWKEVGRLPIDPRRHAPAKGQQTLVVRTQVPTEGALKLEVRELGAATPIRPNP